MGPVTDSASNQGFRIASRIPQPQSPEGDIIDYQMVTIGNPGNTADPVTLMGGVSYEFKIGKYLVSNAEYTAFLNAVASQADTYGLYVESMGTDIQTAGISRTSSNGVFVYEVMISSWGDSTDDYPAAYVSWLNAARFANWMSNGQLSGYQTSQVQYSYHLCCFNHINNL